MVKFKRYTGNTVQSKNRLQIRVFRNDDRGHRWHCSRQGIGWTEYDGPLSTGTYAYVGGKWQNVKKIDALLLAHV